MLLQKRKIDFRFVATFPTHEEILFEALPL